MSKVLQYLVTAKGKTETPADKRRFYPVVVQPTDAKSEKEAEAVARKAWDVGKDEKVEAHVETFRE